MLRFCAIIALLWTFAVPLHAEDLSTTDRAAVQSVIENQLRAFAADDGAGAYQFAAPLIKKLFPDPETFMAMVKNGYSPVYRNKGHAFTDAYLDPQGRPTQRVLLNGMNGKKYEAVYVMERQPDGTWKIAACSLVELQGLDA